MKRVDLERLRYTATAHSEAAALSEGSDGASLPAVTARLMDAAIDELEALRAVYRAADAYFGAMAKVDSCIDGDCKCAGCRLAVALDAYEEKFDA